MGSKLEEIGTDSSTGFQFHQLPVRPIDRPGLTHSGKVVHPATKAKFHKGPELLQSLTIHVSDRTPYSNRETSMVRSPSHEAHSMASETSLACSREPGKGHSVAPLSPSRPRLVVTGEQCSVGPTVASPSTRPTNVYRCLKRRLGHSLRGLHCKRCSVRHRKSPPYQPIGVKSSFSGPQEFRASLQGSDCSDSNGQHNCGFLHQQGGRYEIRLSLCPPLETSVLVSPQRNSSEGSTHSRPLECNSRQAVQTQPGNPDRVVPLSAGVRSLVLEMRPATRRPVCNPVQSQTPQVCITGTGFNSLGSRRHESATGEPGFLCLPSSLPTQPGDLKSDGSRLTQNDSNCSRVTQHALVLGPGQSFGSDSLQASTAKGSGDTTLEWASSQEPQQSESACLASRASAIQEQGFSMTKWQQELRLLRDSQPEPCTNQSGPFLSNGVNQTRWTSGRPL